MAQVIEGPLKDVEIVGSWFSISFDNKIEGIFQEITGLSMDIEVVTITDTSIDTITRNRPGQATYGDITLKRTLSKDKSFYDWADKIRNGNNEYRTGGQIFHYDMGGAPIGSWKFYNAWPSNWSASDLDVGSDDPVIETIKLEIEKLERES